MKNNWIRSAIVNIVIAALVLVFTDAVYETNDDFAISSRIAAGYPYVGFINYFMCRALIPVQSIFTEVNVFVVAQMALSFAAFVFVLKLIMDTSRSRIVVIAATAVIAIFAFDHYCTIQFTKTAALLLVTGMLVMTDSMVNKRGSIYYVYAVLFLFAGVSFRADSLICAVGFAGIYLIVWVIANRKRLIPEGYLTAKRIMLYAVLLALIGFSYGFFQLSEDINEGTPALEEFSDYGELRSDVVDYPVYDHYDENKARYDEIGISENDLYLIDRWYLDYDGAASAENLENILEVDSHSKKEAYTYKDAFADFVRDAVKDIKGLSFTGVHMILLVLIAIWMFTALKPRHWVYVVLIGMFAVSMYLAVYHMQRPVYRALYIADIGSAIWLTYYMAGHYEARRRGTWIGAAAIALMLMLIVPVWNGCGEVRASSAGHVMSSEMSQYIDDNQDKYYVFSASEKKFPAVYLTPLRSPGPECEKNVIGAGSWGTMSPYVLDKMARYGISNPVKDLIDNENAYYVGNSNIAGLTEYYNKWYGAEYGEIYMYKTDEISGFGVWQVKTL